MFPLAFLLLTSLRRLLYHALSKPWFLSGDLSALKLQSPLSSFTSLEEDSRGKSMPVSSRHAASNRANRHRTRNSPGLSGESILCKSANSAHSESSSAGCLCLLSHMIWVFVITWQESSFILLLSLTVGNCSMKRWAEHLPSFCRPTPPN